MELDPIVSAVHYHLAYLLGLRQLNDDFAFLLGFLGDMATRSPQEAWDRKSFLEEYAERVGLDLTSLCTKLLRENPTPPFNTTILGLSPGALKIPPIAVPLFGVCCRPDEVTIASSIPGLNQLLQTENFHVLNRFWGVRHLTAVWAEPGHLRDVIRQAGQQVDFEPVAESRPEKIENGGVPWISLDNVQPSDKINQWFSPVLQRKYNAVAVYCGKRILTLAVSRPMGPRLKAEIEGALRHRFSLRQVRVDEAALQRFVTASESKAINTSGIVQAMMAAERTSRIAENLEVINAEKLQQFGARNREEEQAVIKFVHSILYKAVDMGASDIMFQESPQRLRVRYKLDGDWFDENGEFPGHIAKQVISRIKVISGLEIQYVRLPQDGTFPIKIGDQRYDFRVNTSYQAQGEQAVLRMQRDQRSIKALSALGMPEQYIRAVDEMMNGDHGLLILCGPTGSGKSTTIYSILKSLDSVKNNILTAESPIEIFLENISQTQIDDDGRTPTPCGLAVFFARHRTS